MRTIWESTLPVWKTSLPTNTTQTLRSEIHQVEHKMKAVAWFYFLKILPYLVCKQQTAIGNCKCFTQVPGRNLDWVTPDIWSPTKVLKNHTKWKQQERIASLCSPFFKLQCPLPYNGNTTKWNKTYLRHLSTRLQTHTCLRFFFHERACILYFWSNKQLLWLFNFLFISFPWNNRPETSYKCTFLRFLKLFAGNVC